MPGGHPEGSLAIVRSLVVGSTYRHSHNASRKGQLVAVHTVLHVPYCAPVSRKPPIALRPGLPPRGQYMSTAVLQYLRVRAQTVKSRHRRSCVALRCVALRCVAVVACGAAWLRGSALSHATHRVVACWRVLARVPVRPASPPRQTADAPRPPTAAAMLLTRPASPACRRTVLSASACGGCGGGCGAVVVRRDAVRWRGVGGVAVRRDAVMWRGGRCGAA